MAGTYISQLGAVIVGLASAVILARSLGPEGQGTVQLAVNFASQAALLVSFGLTVSIIYTLSRREFSPGSAAASAVVAACLFGLPAAVLVVLLAPVASSLLLGDQPNGAFYIALAGPLGFLFLLHSLLLGVYRGDQRFTRYNLLNIVSRAVILVGIVVPLLFLEAQGKAMFVGIVAGSAVFSLFLLWRVGRDFGFDFGSARPVLRRLLSFNLKGHVGSVMQDISYRLDLFLIALFLPTRQVGLYGVAVSLAQLMWYLPNAVGLVLLSTTPREEPARANSRLTVITSSLLLVMAVLAIVAALLLPSLIPLIFGREFRQSVPPFLFLLPGIVFLSLWKVLANESTARGRPDVKLKTAAVGAVVTVVLDLILIRRLGIVGAAIASSVAYAACTVYALVEMSRITGTGIRRLLILDKGSFQSLNARIRTALSGP